MASSSSSSPFPVIKAVPRFADVAGNFNDGDLARWAAVAGGATLFGYGVATPSLRGGMTAVAATLGIFGGFLIAYQNSSARLMGLRENKADVKRFGL